MEFPPLFLTRFSHRCEQFRTLAARKQLRRSLLPVCTTSDVNDRPHRRSVSLLPCLEVDEPRRVDVFRFGARKANENDMEMETTNAQQSKVSEKYENNRNKKRFQRVAKMGFFGVLVVVVCWK